MKKNLKNVEIAPRASSQSKPKTAPSKKKITDTAPIEHWDERDIYFDDRGRMIIRNPALANRIQSAVREDGDSITVIVPPVMIPPRPGPPPVDAMCGCRAFILNPDPAGPVEQQGIAGQQSLGWM